jgi:AcrR family transcriptional regulator
MAEPTGSRKRRYTMKARGESTAATRERIVEASEAAFDELPMPEITLGRVAQRAGVSVQTVIRHFGGKEGLFLATLQHTAAKMSGDRVLPPGARPEEAVNLLASHYEEFGDRVLRGLAQEEQVPAMKVLVELGRTYHVEWCKKAFREGLKGLRGARRERRVAELSAVTDVYVWKVLRRDRGLSEAQTRKAMLELVEPFLGREG